MGFDEHPELLEVMEAVNNLVIAILKCGKVEKNDDYKDRMLRIYFAYLGAQNHLNGAMKTATMEYFDNIEKDLKNLLSEKYNDYR